MSSLKPITLYGHPSGPNPWKTAIVLEELGLPYELKMVEMSEVKKKPFTDINPNGRVPAIVDPNGNITLWESGAINYYLTTTYDTTNAISYPAPSADHFHTMQWLMFQMSGQGPYYGQAVWFKRYHPESLPSAKARYEKEAERVISVIDAHLQSANTPYLVGDKCTYADLAFVPWGSLLGFIAPDIDFQKYPRYHEWFGKLTSRPAVQKVLAAKAEAMKNAGH